VTVSLSALHTRAILLDVEGTTTPVELVYQVLFPYARTHVEAFFDREWSSPACREAVALLRQELAAGAVEADAPVAEKKNSIAWDSGPADALARVQWLMDRDRKSPGLKALQGLVWQDGFRTGELRGQVYADVPEALQRWRARAVDVYIYSSGSVLAQRLLFGSTEVGDLTTYLKGHFDTAVGPKTASDSYCLIAERIRVAPAEVLFVSDVGAELDAARTAGMRTALCVRGSTGPDGGGHPVIHTFDDIAN
jgi:enolase-phosphatase E1